MSSLITCVVYLACVRDYSSSERDTSTFRETVDQPAILREKGYRGSHRTLTKWQMKLK